MVLVWQRIRLERMVKRMAESMAKMANLQMLASLLAGNRLPTLREVDNSREQHESAAVAAAAAASTALMQQQQQLQQQQNEYALLLAQAATAAQHQLLAKFNVSQIGLTPSTNVLGHSFFTPQNQPQPIIAPHNQSQPIIASLTQPQPQVGGPSSGYVGNSSPFILPLGSGEEGGGASSSDVMRRLQLIGEDSSGGGASVTSLHSSDSDRQRMDSSLESMGSHGALPSLPSLHQQLERMRLGGGADVPRSLAVAGGTSRRGGPFITRSTSEKVPHRNEILAQVQRTAWARHTTK